MVMLALGAGCMQVLTMLPAQASGQSVLIRHTAMSNTILCMPQERNTANNIFGGFLARSAYEVSPVLSVSLQL